jgi:lipopolysaccharide transport system permease protein
MASPSVVIIEPRRPFQLVDWRELRDYGDLLRFLAWREIAVRYKQSVLGYAWAFLQPFAQVVVFTVVFGVLLGVPSGDVPYPLFALCGVIAWTYFSNATTGAANSLVAQQAVVTKVYFPRLLVPLTPIIAFLIDLSIALSFTIVIVLIWTGGLQWGLAWLPVYVLLLVATSVALGVLLSAANVRYRDVRQGLGLAMQLGMYVTPVIWPLEQVQRRLPEFYWIVGINPLATVVQGFRASMLGMPQPPVRMMGISVIVSVALLVAGLWYFRRTEDSIADVV